MGRLQPISGVQHCLAGLAQALMEKTTAAGCRIYVYTSRSSVVWVSLIHIVALFVMSVYLHAALLCVNSSRMLISVSSFPVFAQSWGSDEMPVL